ncbi:tRNA lysidine(34) synthetase TilS [Pseudomonas taiwanensis]|uniref:tRNA lysidine(34) synthetase TilS n=1 Tax=Pseudomonas taiwanensis TaxID=470150 RepID=UPI0015BA4E0A|nr:tRNA lysidine(34) synthetase TilS [Pseudomonas taiwanensis]NWL78219.1 tRNA lysidine(34) synthetase TilS [Pseudomonas taiwanensis]
MSLESRLLTALAPWRHAPAWHVAFSGGLDSTVLLHVLARLALREALPPLSAIHVHHGLQAAADAWPEHCQRVCTALGVPLKVLRVTVDTGPSLERAARDARYAAFVGELRAGEVLLSAQHRDDQAETLLFRQLRGAGVRGLSGMPQVRPLGLGSLVRPLLQASRAELEAYARAEGIDWVEDPSNSDTSLARNFLRHDVFPVLLSRWPKATESLARSAEHMAEAEGLLGELAQSDLQRAQAGSNFPWLPLPSLDLNVLASLSPPRQRNALRHWLARFTPLPDSSHWAGWEDLRDAAADTTPIWRLARGELHRADGRLWWLSGEWLAVPERDLPWPDPARPLELPGNGGLSLLGAPPTGRLEVRYRRGGEVLELAGRGRRDLKRLLNESRLPAFVRGRLPLLFVDGELVAAANLPELDSRGAGSGQLRWSPPTSDQGLSW